MLEGRIEPGRVFDRTGPLDDVPDGYRLMNERSRKAVWSVELEDDTTLLVAPMSDEVRPSR